MKYAVLLSVVIVVLAHMATRSTSAPRTPTPTPAVAATAVCAPAPEPAPVVEPTCPPTPEQDYVLAPVHSDETGDDGCARAGNRPCVAWEDARDAAGAPTGIACDVKIHHLHGSTFLVDGKRVSLSHPAIIWDDLDERSAIALCGPRVHGIEF